MLWGLIDTLMRVETLLKHHIYFCSLQKEKEEKMTNNLVFSKGIYPKYLNGQTSANSLKPSQILQNAVCDQV